MKEGRSKVLEDTKRDVRFFTIGMCFFAAAIWKGVSNGLQGGKRVWATLTDVWMLPFS